ncbi:Ankyrin repeats (3 copies) [Chryseobacterium sp. MOF25P]|uniref:ankyrin repeat domain-containing protein n=1 Tax=Chryseobacterium sp. MOF25P TaxID=1664318 RepID=UPI0008057C26|nr:ankyrin repeat domain-containing protein [Chryseobacterium sp. MOF25P]OBW39847.1 Ankyrin repeats (3 copies) [Chryseobacterium sp. MOF25P]OBW46212.1 Ankyrin repeats (3 copies) [Chryseobacterium sp. BGARF1]
MGIKSKLENVDKIWELLEMCYYGHIEQVKRLLEEGVDINGIGNNGMSPLDAAKNGENDDIVGFLLSMGAKEGSNSTDELI